MMRRSASSFMGIPVALGLVASLPWLCGQGCPNMSSDIGVLPDTGLTPSDAGQTVPGDGLGLPSFRFIVPETDIFANIGDLITISWVDDDPDSNALITLLIDPDGEFGNGNEIVILPVAFEDDDLDGDSFVLDTSGLVQASYRVVARINDTVNPELIALSTGKIHLLAGVFDLGNQSPSVVVTAPTVSMGVLQGDVVDIAYCAEDADDGGSGLVPDVIIMLDFDDNPRNDLDLTTGGTAAAEARLEEICQSGFFPRQIDGAIVLGCASDDDCQNANLPTAFQIPSFDVALIPPRPGGEPYYVRVTIWDHANPPVHDYAAGRIHVTALVAGAIDLGQIGRTLAGAKFQGFSTGDRAGSSGTGVGDYDGDGADEFVIVSQFGRPGEVGNIGGAHFIYGIPGGGKFASEISLNSVSVTVRGAILPMFGTGPGCQIGGPIAVPGLVGTDGIVSVTRVGDVNGDGLSEILFGMPEILQFFDHVDDDPCDCQCCDPTADPPEITCYLDGLPNPYSTDTECLLSGCGGDPLDHMEAHDWREIMAGLCFCTNDLDPARSTPIDGGYAIMLGSDNVYEFSTVALNMAGQRGGGPSQAPSYSGARWRGPWYDEFDDSQTIRPYAIIPDNRFGETVRSMPTMTDTTPTTPADYGSTVIISAPLGARGRGMISLFSSVDFTTYSATNSQSFPDYVQGGDCPGCWRDIVSPGFSSITGQAIGDELGYGDAAGDYNLDGSRDVLCGAPGADRNGVNDVGIIYIIFGRPDWGSLDLAEVNPPRMEIHGVQRDDRFGSMQTIVGDVDNDGLPDIGFASHVAGDDGPGGVDSGFIGIIFGGRPFTGENIFTIEQVGTLQLPGVRIYGSQPGGHAGTFIENAGDFNADAFDDMLIVAPDETRIVDGQIRRGVVYLLFGGPHLTGEFTLDQVGTDALPGMVFTSPYLADTADEAPTDYATGIGDVNGDGFDDLLIGVSTADFVNPFDPNQRRIDSGEAYLIYGNNIGSNNPG